MRVSVGAGPLRFGGPVALVGWVLVRALHAVGRLLLLAASHPRRSGAVIGWAAGGWLLVEHTVAVLALLAVAVHAVDAWSLVSPASWRRHGRPVALGWARRAAVYGRLWRSAVTVAGLDRDGRLPRLGRVRSLERVDVVEVRALLGQRFAAWQDAGPMLAHVFGAADVRVHRGDDRRLTLELVRARRGRSWRRGHLELEPPRTG